MKRTFLLAVPLVFFALCLSSCTNAQKQFDKGNYKGAINSINKLSEPTSEDLLLKAKAYIALGEPSKAQEALVLYLLMDEGHTAPERQFAVDNLLAVNDSASLAILVLDEDDGVEARKALYLANVELKNLDRALQYQIMLIEELGYRAVTELALGSTLDAGFILELFTKWYETIDEGEYSDFLYLLSGFSSARTLSEQVAKDFLALTDVLMTNDYYTGNDIRLSSLLKTKGNILDKLYDKVNARIYWTQAYRLNPSDEELRKKMQ